jgi:hypothetical protein
MNIKKREKKEKKENLDVWSLLIHTKSRREKKMALYFTSENQQEI